jgi:hypothetical protein
MRVCGVSGHFAHFFSLSSIKSIFLKYIRYRKKSGHLARRAFFGKILGKNLLNLHLQNVSIFLVNFGPILWLEIGVILGLKIRVFWR